MRLFLFVILAFVFGTSAFAKNPACSLELFLQARHFKTAQLKPYFGRYPKDAAKLPTNYLHNAREAFHYFHEWFSQPTFGAFKEMTCEMHRISALGVDGRHYFKSSGGTASGYDSREIMPGRTRQSFAMGRKPTFTMLAEKDSKELGIPIPRLTQRLSRPTPAGTHRDYGWLTQIDGISAKASPASIRSYGKTFYRYYPVAEYLDEYLVEMEKTLKKIHRGSPFENKNQAKFLKLLAHYYHVAINALLFHRLNNSMFMNQVNYLLMLNGLNPILHGELDFQAMYLSSDDFYEKFLAAIQTTNQIP